MSPFKALVVVSHYQGRPLEPLHRLMAQLKALPAPPTLLLVINDDGCASESLTSQDQVQILRRPNTGMNIGAWHAAFHCYGTRYQNYLFMQDECEIMRPDFLEAYCLALSKGDVGMIGESLNPKWAYPWESMAQSPLNYPIGVDAQGAPVRRVSYYLHCMRQWGIDPGPHGRHLRALVWGLRSDVLTTLGGFPLGRHKEECIAAEIAVSKAVEQNGLRVTQLSPEPFAHIRHAEWHQDGSGKL